MSEGPKTVMRWGIASAGLICHDFACALNKDDKGHHVVTAVAARELSRAQEFAKKHSIAKAYGNYEDLAKDPDIDVVYIGSIPLAHVDIAKIMIAANKPVLVEKPGSINFKLTKEMMDFASQRNILCVEGMWSRFFPAYKKALEVIESGEVGDVFNINFVMGFEYSTLHEMDWRMDLKRGGGMSLAFGCYAVSLAQSIYKENPINVVANCNKHKDGGDQTSSFILQYSNGRSMVCTVSSQCKLENVATIHCTKGIVKLINPWAPTKVKVNDQWFTYPLRDPGMKINYFNALGFLYEMDHMRELILKGAKESSIMPQQTSLDNAQTVDSIRAQLGVVFPEDL